MAPAIVTQIRRARLSLAVFNRVAKRVAHEVMQGVLFFGGLAAVAYGAWMIYHPAGVILAGMFGVWFSFLTTD
jgi:hypothetical protein